MQLKSARDLEAKDLLQIESPFFACCEVSISLESRNFSSIWNLEKFLREAKENGYPNGENPEEHLLKEIEDGSLFLLMENPFSPIVKWIPQEDHPLKGRWEVDESLDIFPRGNILFVIRGIESNACTELKIMETKRENLEPFFPGKRKKAPEPPREDNREKAVVQAGTIKKASLNSRSVSEGVGKAGMEEAKKRLGYTTDPRYIDRYHGPDDIAQSREGRLSEWEAKGNKITTTAVAQDTEGFRQGSSPKNAKRAEVMVRDKSKKIGIPSNRQGGAYTEDEIDLWKEIEDRSGSKQHISVHTNTETGKVVVIERDLDGNKDKILDEFTIENIDEVKNTIKKGIKK